MVQSTARMESDGENEHVAAFCIIPYRNYYLLLLFVINFILFCTLFPLSLPLSSCYLCALTVEWPFAAQSVCE